MLRRGNAVKGSVPREALLGVLLLAVAGCGSTKAAKGTGGSGEGPGAISQGLCGPGDTTESCCLKTHPGQYARCGVIPPKEPGPGVPPPLLPDASLLEEESEMAAAERRQQYREICLPYYERCIEKGGEGKRGRKHGETRCQQCFDACMTHGFWPLRANRQVCP